MRFVNLSGQGSCKDCPDILGWAGSWLLKLYLPHWHAKDRRCLWGIESTLPPLHTSTNFNQIHEKHMSTGIRLKLLPYELF